MADVKLPNGTIRSAELHWYDASAPARRNPKINVWHGDSNLPIVIPESELTINFVRSSGPGGQNVNKVSTAVELRFDISRSPSLPEDIRRRLRTLAGNRVTQDGVLIIMAREHRTQEANRAAARDRLDELVARAEVIPKTRRASRPTLGSKIRRLTEKSQRSFTKKQRDRKDDD